MRFIYEQERTRKMLEEWAKPHVPVMASFFFWNSGTPEQRSQLGFLRSLLFEVLQKYEELIPVIFPWLWAKQYSRLTDRSRLERNSWSLSQLKQGFKRLVNQRILAFRLCLFVNGLDEYEGDHEEIASLFHTITSSRLSSVKVCVSSRPLLGFHDAFGGEAGLRLQDLTYRGDCD